MNEPKTVSEELTRSAMAARTRGEPRDVAARVRREHATVRALLDDVARACLAARARRLGAHAALLRAVRELSTTFEEHVVVEDALVAPVLCARETFGAVHAADVVAEHAELRRVLRELVDETARDAVGIERLAAHVGDVADRLRAVMVAEERWLAVLERP